MGPNVLPEKVCTDSMRSQLSFITSDSFVLDLNVLISHNFHFLSYHNFPLTAGKKVRILPDINLLEEFCPGVLSQMTLYGFDTTVTIFYHKVS
jgi:hypothetical protein